MKIAFFGTSPFGLPALDSILSSKHRLAAVVTTHDKPSGRHLKLTPSPVKAWALSKGLPVIETGKAGIVEVGERLKKEGVDAFVVISFGVILPQAVLDAPRLGAYNVHSSLLPRWRGPAPIHWAILAGDPETGVTVMRMDAGLDTGDVVLQETAPVFPDDDERKLHDRLAAMAAPLLQCALALVEEKKASFARQDEKLATYARKITKEDGRVHWAGQSPDEIVRRVRALASWPGVYAFSAGKRFLFRKVSAVAGAAAGRPGEILEASPSGILISAGAGAIRVEEIQAEGRNAMPVAAFLQGTPMKRGDVFE